MIKPEELRNECKECNEIVPKNKMFKTHLKKHGHTIKSYYDKHYKQENEDRCVKCGSKILFSENIRYNDLEGNKLIFVGYRRLCSTCSIGVSLENLKIKYGEEIGKKKWEQYCEKQRYSVSFEYWNEKTGMSKEEYEIFNKRYGRTLEHFVSKYGEEEGTIKYNETIESIKYTQSKEYYMEKYGDCWEEKWKEVCLSKSNSLQASIDRYGEEEGTIKYIEKIEKTKPYVSEMSQNLFDMVFSEMYDSSEGVYYARLNKEYGKLYKNSYYFYDFVDIKRKKVIEFNGECFHTRTPDNENYFNFRKPKETAQESFEKDAKKREAIESFGFEVLYVWENDYETNKERVKEECVKFLMG